MNNENPENKPEETPEAVAAASAPAAAAQPVEEPNAEENGCAQIQVDLDRFRDLAMRTQADFENYRKRSVREREDAVKYANAAFLERLIPVVDNFEFGLQAARGEGSQAVLTGFEMVAKQLQDFLSSSGVEVIDAEGKTFDPNLHEALGAEESETVPEGTVIRQLRKGYKLKDRLVRPANVFVSKGKPQASAE